MHTADGETAKRQPVILLADDDQLCLDVGVRMLQKLGFTVLEAKDGQEAIEVYKNNRNSGEKSHRFFKGLLQHRG